MSTSFEDLLAADLRSAADDAGLAGLDPDVVIGAGRRAVRRRQLVRVGSAAAVVAAVAVVGTSLWGGGEDRTLPATPSPTVTAASTARITLAPNGGRERQLLVTLTPGTRGIEVQYGEDAGARVTNLGGSMVDPARPVATFGFRPGSPFLVGVVPSATARDHVEVVTDDDDRGYTTEVVPVPGTGWSAFALAFDTPFTETSQVTALLWFRPDGRPVDLDGGVGSLVDLDGRTAWLSADGTTFGMEPTDRGAGFSRQVTDPDDLSYTAGGTDQDWEVVGILPAAARHGTAHFADGQAVDFVTVPLGDRRAFRVEAGAGQPQLLDVRWYDEAGEAHSSAPSS